MHNLQNPHQSTAYAIDDQYDMDAVYYHTKPFYSFRGRIGRLRYLAYFILLTWIAMIIAGATFPLVISLTGELKFTLGILLLLPSVLVVLYANIVPSVRRLHDLNRTGWWCLLNCIPYINIIFALYLLCAPGDANVNDYGVPAEPPSTWVKIVAALAIIMFVAGFLAAIVLPMVQDGTI